MKQKRKPWRPRKEEGTILPPQSAIEMVDQLNFVRNWDDLAQELSVSRKSLQNWRTREDLRGAADFPRPRADGRHDVDAWRRFMIAHGLKRADESVEAEDIPGKRRTIRDWKEYREELSCREAERRMARGDELLLVATELEVPLGATFVAIQTKLSQFAPRVARFMVMCRDEASAEEKLRDEMDAVLTDLNLAAYLDGAVAETAGAFPFDDETSQLYAKVSFAGQDRALFIELIDRCVTEAVRRIGRRALAATPPAAESIQESRPAGNPDKPALPVQVAAPSAELVSKSRKPRRKPREMTRARKRAGV